MLFIINISHPFTTIPHGHNYNLRNRNNLYKQGNTFSVTQKGLCFNDVTIINKLENVIKIINR